MASSTPCTAAHAFHCTCTCRAQPVSARAELVLLLLEMKSRNDFGQVHLQALPECLSWLPPLQGLSEPVGALIALLFVKPFLTPLLLQYMLAFVGGIMVGKHPPAVPSHHVHPGISCELGHLFLQTQTLLLRMSPCNDWEELVLLWAECHLVLSVPCRYQCVGLSYGLRPESVRMISGWVRAFCLGPS